MKTYDRVYETVNLDAIRHNMEVMKNNIKPGTRIIGVVKADGYGHGSVPVALAIDSYVWAYATATVEEAVILRNHGITKPIIILGSAPESSYEQIIRYDLQPTVFQMNKAVHLSDLACKEGKIVSVHIALDTGMSRIGYFATEEAAEETAAISRLPGIRIEGLFTHFAKADEKDKSFADHQMEEYQRFVSMVEEKGVEIPTHHCANSAGILELQQFGFDAVRAGIAIYGLYPSDEVDRESVKLIPAMELKSSIVYKKVIPKGTPVSYGGIFTADKETTVATIPVGYGDGYPRSLSNKGFVLIRGKRARILGRVCMDQLMADITGIPEAEEGDEVTLIGRDGNEMIAVEELASISGGFHYEIICDIGKRVPRVYLENHHIVGTKDCFDEQFPGFSNHR